MPQLDFYMYFTSIFHLVLFFFVFYFSTGRYFFEFYLYILKLRHKYIFESKGHLLVAIRLIADRVFSNSVKFFRGLRKFPILYLFITNYLFFCNYFIINLYEYILFFICQLEIKNILLIDNFLYFNFIRYNI